MKFRNPANGYVELVGFGSTVCALLFGFFWFAIKGLWRHVVIQLVAIVVLFAAFGPPGTLFVILMWVIYGFAATTILGNDYLRKGWQVVTHDGTAAGAPIEATPGTKKCPYCAEDVKAEAIKCKHCGSDLPATPQATPQWSPARAIAPPGTDEFRG